MLLPEKIKFLYLSSNFNNSIYCTQDNTGLLFDEPRDVTNESSIHAVTIGTFGVNKEAIGRFK